MITRAQFKNIILYLFLGIFFLYPFRVEPNTSFQLYQYCMACFATLVILLEFRTIYSMLRSKPFVYLLFFTITTTFINAYYFSIYRDSRFLIDLSFYLIYLIIAVYSFLLINENRIKQILFLSTLVLLPTLAYLLFFNIGSEFNTATYNNKNQLAQWAFYLAVFSVFTDLKTKRDRIIKVIVFTGAICISSITITRAVTFSVCISLIYLFFTDMRSFLMVILISLFLLTLHYSLNSTHFDQTVQKIESKYLKSNSKYDTFMGRGYWRILAFPSSIIFGKGERMHRERFDDPYEIHSSYGNLLFAYGLIGISMLFLFYQFFFSKISYDLIIIISVLFLSFFHNIFKSPFIMVLPVLYYYRNNSKITKF